MLNESLELAGQVLASDWKALRSAFQKVGEDVPPINGPTYKCPACQKRFARTTENFSLAKQAADGLFWRCRECDKKRCREYRERNRERISARRRELKRARREAKSTRVELRRRLRK